MDTQELYNQLDPASIAFLESLSATEKPRWELILKHHPWIKRYKAQPLR
jgi:hypothetical protein